MNREGKERYGNHYKHDPYYADFVDLKSIIERHIGMKWEDIIK